MTGQRQNCCHGIPPLQDEEEENSADRSFKRLTNTNALKSRFLTRWPNIEDLFANISVARYRDHYPRRPLYNTDPFHLGFSNFIYYKRIIFTIYRITLHGQHTNLDFFILYIQFSARFKIEYRVEGKSWYKRIYLTKGVNSQQLQIPITVRMGKKDRK